MTQGAGLILIVKDYDSLCNDLNYIISKIQPNEIDKEKEYISSNKVLKYQDFLEIVQDCEN